jgi:hypothetical protein
MPFVGMPALAGDVTPAIDASFHVRRGSHAIR